MARYLGVDTSNYTTSVCVYEPETGRIWPAARLLQVKSGEKGLRQSDALFQHTVQLPRLMEQLRPHMQDLRGVGVSYAPRRVEGSYMPCFLAGLSAAHAAAAALGVPCREFSHQEGHLMAVVSELDPSQQEQLLAAPFLAFHLSGGTTELLLVRRSAPGFQVEVLGGTLDISVGQLIDRAGVLLGLNFPCGRELDALAATSQWSGKVRVSLRDGWCNLSGFENQCRQKLQKGEPAADVARWVLTVVAEHLMEMVAAAEQVHPGLPLVMMGGVASNSLLRQRFAGLPGRSVYFASGERSRDNAIGISVLASME
ncbi:MAG: hypothetical protein ACOX7F_02975 [Eubacteriales bacterium]|jgi:N6-L-threonylcarbamoyladenine synthase